MTNSLTRNLNLKINISLCSELSSYSYPRIRLKSDNIEHTATTNGDNLKEASDLAEIALQQSVNIRSSFIPPPPWAVAARGESRLEVSVHSQLVKTFLMQAVHHVYLLIVAYW